MASTTVVHLQKVLQHPLQQRCTELTKLIQELSLKELQTLYPMIVEDIFGFGSGNGWGLKRLALSTRRWDFEVVRNFLAPEGPLLHLAYKLLIFGDGHLRYEFPFSCVPNPSRQMIEEGAVPIFYSNKLNYQGPGRIPTSVLLSPFDYFLFHFAYFIVNTQNPRSQYTLTHSSETLYPCLLEDYLRAFLPTGSNPSLQRTPSPALSQQTYSPAQYSGIGYCPSTTSHGHHHTSTIHHHRSLLKQSSNISPTPSTSTPNHGTMDTIQIETWRSEAFVLILTEFWLNAGSLESHRCYHSNLEHTIPSHDHMQMVRNFVKYLHYFANSAQPVVTATGYAYEQMNAMELLKCTILQQFVQKRLYWFLRLTFDKWPLDASFRLPLETWLSYIQPWRYTDLYGDKQHLLREEDHDQTANPRWQKFVADNLLFYNVIFQKLLPRFLRMELTSPKNAYMLFRVTKVFSQPSLSAMIEEVESTLQETTSRATSPHNWSVGSENTFSLGRSSFRSPRDVTIAGNLRHQFLEMEGQGFVFIPLFGDDVRKEISLLLGLISQAREESAKLIEKSEEPQKGIFSDIFRLLSLPSEADGSEDYSSADNQKVEQYLKISSDNLCSIFRVHPQPICTQRSYTSLNTISPERSSSSLPPDYLIVDDKSILTDVGRYQIINKLRKVNVSYKGHPDLQPIRSFEITFLVRYLWHIALYLNSMLESRIEDMYYRSGLLGRITRQMVAAPCVYYELDKSCQKYKYIPYKLPPRVNLRWLAHKQTVGYLLAYFFISFLSGYNFITALAFIILLLMFYIVIKALFCDVPIISTSLQPVEPCSVEDL